jgi:hypothetical protein
MYIQISNLISTLYALKTLELLHQEIASTSANLNEKRYASVSYQKHIL